MSAALTTKETEIYDRQLRLWGVEAQQRMRGARVYIAGLSGIGTEVTKNLVLAGVSVTLLDAQVVTPAHLSVNFCLGGEGSVGINVRASGSWPPFFFILSLLFFFFNHPGRYTYIFPEDLQYLEAHLFPHNFHPFFFYFPLLHPLPSPPACLGKPSQSRGVQPDSRG